jgi:hypothetical protein
MVPSRPIATSMSFPAPLRADAPAPARHRVRRERAVVLAVAAALVVARSIVFLIYEQAYFDSDQAIVGLMAKHLSEGRAFPLFFYGQDYMLGVEAWWAVPFFWIGGPTVAALRASLIATNLAIAVLLIVGLERGCGLRPWQALLASLFFVLAPPRTAAFLVEAQGGNVEPFLYVALLWFLRHRPVAFGLVLGIGVMNREFTIYAVPVMAAIALLETPRPSRRALARVAATALVACAAWQSVQVLKPYADMMGPGTRGQLLRGSSGSQAANLAARFRPEPARVPGRVVAMTTDVGAALVGARHRDDIIAPQGHWWVGVALVGLAVVALSAITRPWVGRPPGRPLRVAVLSAAFGWYLAGVGMLAVAVYVTGRPVEFGTVRYALLGLLVLIGVVAVAMASRPPRWARCAITVGVLVWGVGSAIDTGQLAWRYAHDPPPNHVRILADALVARGIRVAEASYWRAYRVSFIAREQVRVASTDMKRIEEYQALAWAEGRRLLTIQEAPCPGGSPVDVWYLCPAPD